MFIEMVVEPFTLPCFMPDLLQKCLHFELPETDCLQLLLMWLISMNLLVCCDLTTLLHAPSECLGLLLIALLATGLCFIANF